MIHADCIMRLQSHYHQYWKLAHMANLNRFEPFRGTPTLHEQLNRMFGEGFNRQEESNLTTCAPAVDIMETEHELIVKADLPDVDPKDLDIRVENNILTIRGERRFEKQTATICASNGPMAHLRGTSRWLIPSAIKTDYQNGVLTLHIPKREEAKPKQIKVNVGTQATSTSATSTQTAAAAAAGA